MIIPDQINFFLVVLGIILVFFEKKLNIFDSFGGGSFLGHYSLLLGFRSDILINRSAVVIFGIVFFGLIILISRGRGMGMGDLKLSIPLGLIFGWPDVLLIVTLAFVIGSVFSIILIISKGKRLKDAIPFGPFLVVGSAVVFFAGYAIVNGYFKLFGIV